MQKPSYDIVRDELGIGHRLYLPDGSFFEHRDVNYFRLPNDFLDASKLDGNSFIRIFQSGNEVKGRLRIATRNSISFNSNMGLVNQLMATATSIGFPYIIPGLLGRNECILNGGKNGKIFDDSNLKTSINPALENLVKVYADDKDFSTEKRTNIGLPLGVAGGTALTTAITGMNLQGDALGYLMGMLIIYSLTGLYTGARIGEHFDLKHEKKLRDQEPTRIKQAILSGKDNDKLVQGLALFLEKQYQRLLNARQEERSIEMVTTFPKEALSQIINKKNALINEVAKLEILLGNTPLTFGALVEQNTTGVFVEYTTKNYDLLCKLLRMTLGYEPAVDMREALANAESPPSEVFDLELANVEVAKKVVNTSEPFQVNIKKTLEEISDSEHKVGDVVEDYELLEPIGQGGMGTWYRAKSSEGEVAIKFINPETRETFLRNLDTLQRVQDLDHEKILKVKRVIGGEKPYIVAEYVPGVNLRDIMEAEELPVEVATDLIYQVATAIKEAHNKGLLHHDIKPENVLVRPDGSIKLADFDNAETLEAKLLSTTLRSVANVVGTQAYVAPERTGEVGGSVGPHSDIYSLGILAHELLTGFRKVDSVSMTNNEVPQNLQDLVHKSLIVDPCLRIQDSNEIIETLEDLPRRRLTFDYEGRPIATTKTFDLMSETLCLTKKDGDLVPIAPIIRTEPAFKDVINDDTIVKPISAKKDVVNDAKYQSLEGAVYDVPGKISMLQRVQIERERKILILRSPRSIEPIKKPIRVPEPMKKVLDQKIIDE